MKHFAPFLRYIIESPGSASPSNHLKSQCNNMAFSNPLLRTHAVPESLRHLVAAIYTYDDERADDVIFRGAPCFAPRILFLSHNSDLYIRTSRSDIFSAAPHFALCLPSEHALLHRYKKLHNMGVVLFPWATGLIPFLKGRSIRHLHDLYVLEEKVRRVADEVSAILPCDVEGAIAGLDDLFGAVHAGLWTDHSLEIYAEDVKPYILHCLHTPTYKLGDLNHEHHLLLGERTLQRRFLQTVGVSPSQYMRAVRNFLIVSTLSCHRRWTLQQVQEHLNIVSRTQFQQALNDLRGELRSFHGHREQKLDAMTSLSVDLMDGVKEEILRSHLF